MGLDMYLYEDVYVPGWDHYNNEARSKYNQIVELLGLEVTPESPSINVRPTVAYWRKANAIHGWFVHNVQNDVDDCREAYVSRDQLEELRNLSKRILDSVVLTPDKAEAFAKLENPGGGDAWPFYANLEDNDIVGIDEKAVLVELPPVSGFFFGGTGIDADYIYSLANTVEQLDKILARKTASEFYYRSSW